MTEFLYEGTLLASNNHLQKTGSTFIIVSKRIILLNPFSTCVHITYLADREHIADILVMHGEDPGDVERLRNLSPAQIDGLRVNNVEPDQ